MTMKCCPFCAEEVQAAAIKCKHCGEMIGPSPPGQRGSHCRRLVAAVGSSLSLMIMVGLLMASCGPGARRGGGGGAGGGGGGGGPGDTNTQSEEACDDGFQSPGEADVDCGGTLCPPCAVGRRCDGPRDCVTETCRGGVCIPPGNCNDGELNGDETYIDCGGSCPVGCDLTRPCGVNLDCSSGCCNEGFCVVEEESDLDGLCAPDDPCPDNAAVPAGPDRDGDCVADADDACPDLHLDTPDRDGDCVSDAEDACPDLHADRADRDGDCVDDLTQMVRIEAGEFLMGSPVGEPDRDADETQHRVEITRPFLLAATEVTQARWREVMEGDPSAYGDCGDTCPVEQVSWFDVVEFCNALSRREGLEECYDIDGDDVTWPRGLDCTGYRLPTEAEWEYAARAGTQTAWSCGADAACLDGVAWYDDNSDDTTHPVGTKAANAWGLYDMHGNVREWVWDWHDDDYYADGQVDPTGPAAGAFRVNRGGGWYRDAAWLRAAFRFRLHPTRRGSSLGFRPARSVP